MAESRTGTRGGILPWALLVTGSLASLAANVAVAEPTMTGRVVAAWPSFSLIAAYELLMRQVRQVRRVAEATDATATERKSRRSSVAADVRAGERPVASGAVTARHMAAGREVWQTAWRRAQDNRADDGSLPSGRDIGGQYGRHERWGRMVKRAGLAGELDLQI
jgi:hypothetical protein